MDLKTAISNWDQYAQANNIRCGGQAGACAGAGVRRPAVGRPLGCTHHTGPSLPMSTCTFSGWVANGTLPMCLWTGVTCNSAGRVTAL